MADQQAKIQIYGTGCPTCQKLHESADRAVAQLGLDIEVEYITDLKKIMAAGLMSLPAIVINGKMVSGGLVPDLKKIKALIDQNIKS